jgi:CBS domain-containing membrane protein
MVMVRVKKITSSFFIAPSPIDSQERWRAFLGVSFGVVVTAVVNRWCIGGNVSLAWLIAPMGASAVLVFALPASPMAQPWAVLGGNTRCLRWRYSAYCLWPVPQSGTLV